MLKLRTIGLAVIPLLPHLASAGSRDICYLHDAAAPSVSTAYVLCEQGMLYGTRDGGATWTMFRTQAKETLISVAFSDADHGFVVGDAGTLLITDDGAKTWQSRSADTKENLLTVYAIGNEVWIGGFDGVIRYSADGGRSWKAQDGGTTQSIEDIYFADPQHGWASGWTGTILRTVNGGAKWEVVNTPATWSLASIYFRDLKDGWATGFGGELLRSKDGGATWEVQKSPVNTTLSSIAVDRDGRIWVAADEQLLVSENGGDTWRALPVEYKLFLTKVLPVGDSLWAVGELGVLKQASSGLEWKRLDSLQPASAQIADSLDAAPVFKSADSLDGK